MVRPDPTPGARAPASASRRRPLALQGEHRQRLALAAQLDVAERIGRDAGGQRQALEHGGRGDAGAVALAAAVAFLASPDASFITAATLTVDGGFNA